MGDAIQIPIVVDPKEGVAGIKIFEGAAKSAGKGISALKGHLESALGVEEAVARGTEKLIEGIVEFVNSLFESSEKVDHYAESLKTALDKTGEERAMLEALISVARNETNTRLERNNAIAKLQKMYPEYLGNISLETINSQEATTAINALTESIINKAIAEAAAAKIAEKSSELLQLNADRAKFLKQYGNTIIAPITLQKFDDKIREVKDDIIELRKVAADSLALSLNFTPVPKEVKAPKVKKPKAKKKDDFDLDKAIGNYAHPVQFKVDPDIKAQMDQFEKLTKLYKGIYDNDQFKRYKQAQKEIIKNNEELLQQNIQLANTISGAVAPAFTALYDAIISGQQPLQAFFKAILSAINSLIKKLIEAAIKAAILSILTGGSSGGKKGLSFIDAFKKVVGFASGGLVTGPVSALVGEGIGTSAANPEVVAPLDKLRSFFSDMIGSKGTMDAGNVGTSGINLSIPSSIRLFASGRDLVGVLALEQLSQNRR